jgi:predicted AAA+ superfamily ATPase
MEKYIKRPQYTNFLCNWKDKNIIKVISGVRRSGKSTLLTMFQEELRESGIKDDQIHNINFESREYRKISNIDELENLLYKHMDLTKMNYVFLDEIERIPEFEKVVDSLFVEKNVDVYITGSNAYFLSSELATLLSGRYVELSILPLSFEEFVRWQRENRPDRRYFSLAMHYQKYLKSSFPFTLILEKDEDITTYLEGIYSTVLVKDVVTKHDIANIANLERINQFLFSVIGSMISTNKIKNTLASNGLSLSPLTVDKYVSALEAGLLFYPACKYNVRGKRLLAREEKLYAVDIGLRNVILPDANEDAGHILENIIFLELLRRKRHVYVGKYDEYEIDFVTVNTDDSLEFYQVALTTLDEKILKRELRPLQKLNNSYPKFLLTLDEINPNANYEGIRKINALEWLLDISLD